MTGQYLDLSRLLKVQKFCVYTTKCNYNITSWTDKTLIFFEKKFLNDVRQLKEEEDLL